MIEVRIMDPMHDIHKFSAEFRCQLCENIRLLFGFWENNILIGGAAIGDVRVDGRWVQNTISFQLSINTVVEYGIIFQKILKVILPTCPQIQSVIDLNNHKSLKGTLQLGFRKLYIHEGIQVLIFDKSMWRYETRWPL